MSVQTPLRRPERDELQALIEEARQRARRRRRRNVTVLAAALVAAASAVLAIGFAGRGAKGRSGSSVPASVKHASAGGRFWYARAVSSTHERLPAGGITMDRRGFTHRHGPEVLFDVRLTEETWVGTDGTMRDRVTAAARFATAIGRAMWAAWSRPRPNFNAWLGRDALTVGGGVFPPRLWYPAGEGLGPYALDVRDSLFRYRQLLSLPTSATAVRASLMRAENALAWRENHTQKLGYETTVGTLGELGDIAGLASAPLPASVRLALFRAAAALPGAKLNVHARDQLGRPGAAVVASSGLAMQRLIFDPSTGAMLEGPRGTVVAQGAVGSVYALPKGIGAIRAPGGPAPPPRLAITPPTGTPTTAFKVTVAPSTDHPAHKAPTLDWVLAGTPGAQCFAREFPQPLPPSATTRLAGRPGYLYRLRPSNIQRHKWCPGQYELNATLDYSHRTHIPHPGSPGMRTFTTETGSSTYLQVR